MIRFEPLRPAHVPMIALRAGQVGALGLWAPDMTEDYGKSLIAAGPAWAAFDRQGIVGAAGFGEVFKTQASAWAMMTDRIGAHRTAIVRFVRWQLAMAKWARIEALTRHAWPEQARFARACGFRHVATLQCHGPACETADLWEVVRAGT